MNHFFEYIKLNFKNINTNQNETNQFFKKMAAYYNTNQDYPAFSAETSKPEIWAPIKKEILKIIEKKGECRILEFGAGKTGFSKYLGETRKLTLFDVQDITNSNLIFLNTIADNVFSAEITKISQKYDIIFSTFVWEHLHNPKVCLDHLLTLLENKGSLFIISPKYDFPLYLSNSAKHLSPLKKLFIGMWLFFRRLRQKILQKPDFLIHTDPALFHLPFFRDIDAIHWVSEQDIKYSISSTHMIKKIDFETHGIKELFWKYFLLMYIRISPNLKGK